MTSTSKKIDALIAASVDERAHNIFHRQTQLERLHNVYQHNAVEIKDAILADSSVTPTEADIEFFASVKCIKDAYASLSPATELEDEYRIANGQDSPHNRIPVGIVTIKAINHTLFYSVLGPLSSAIAEGNCVILVLQQNLRKSNSLLRKLLVEALEQDTIAIVDEDPRSSLPAPSTLRVVQHDDETAPQVDLLASSLSSPVVAIVDRTANLRIAAEELVAARFCFGGSSPYAPDVVLVNEFCKQDFVQAVVEQCVKYGRHSNGPINEKSDKSVRTSIDQALDQLRKSNDALRVVVQETGFAVADVHSRQLKSLPRQQAPVLVIRSVRSIDDSIEIMSRTKVDECAAAYHFGSLETGQYLARFVSSRASFINHVPRELLLGPTYPTGHSIDLETRYPRHLFSRSSPQFVTPSTSSMRYSSALNGKTDDALAEDASEALVVIKRPDGKGIGFFEQGLLLNVSLILFGTLSVSAAGVYYIRKMFR